MSRTLSLHLNILHPVNLLPPEILSEIFLLVQGSDAEKFPPPMGNGMLGFNSWMAVSHVCQHWRYCVLQTPLLWRRVVLGTDVKHPGNLGMLYLERSNPCAFEFNLDCSGPNIKEARVQLWLFQRAIQKARHRISGVHITVHCRLAGRRRFESPSNKLYLSFKHSCTCTIRPKDATRDE